MHPTSEKSYIFLDDGSGDEPQQDDEGAVIPPPDESDVLVKIEQTGARPVSFPLRGDSVNRVVDACAPLMALVLRISQLDQYEHLVELHKKTSNEVEAIELELQKLGYGRVHIMALRYCLCSFIDEAIMNSRWGSESSWSERSLLSLYHNETWGGEKVFIILDRLISEPERYIELIEFIYMCLCLGFEGKYKIMHNGRVHLERVIRQVHDIIRKHRGEAAQVFSSKYRNIYNVRHSYKRMTSLATVAISGLVAIAAIYAFYYLRLDNYTDDIVLTLRDLLG